MISADAIPNLNDTNIIMTLDKLASLHRENGNISNSVTILHEVYKIQQNSLELGTNYLQRNLSMGVTLRKIAELYHEQGMLRMSLITAQKSVAVLKSFLLSTTHQQSCCDNDENDNTCFCAELVSSMLLLGSLAQETGEPIIARSIFYKAINIIDDVTNDDARFCPCNTINTLREINTMLATSHCAPVA